MAEFEAQKSIQSSLESLKNLDSLKKLFWSQLNYERVNQALSRRQWADLANNELIEDPLVLAAGGAENTFRVIYARLKSENLSKESERCVVNQLLKDNQYALFVFSNKSQSRWHFLNVKYDNSPQKRKLFRRIAIGEGEQLRTATERISLLNLESINPDAAPLDIQALHDEAFDVEAVTQAFFQEYQKIFDAVEKLISGIENKERKRLFTQKLFNRLLFVAFVQKKGWLKFQDRTDYLSALWEDFHQNNNSQDNNFYRQRLSRLFFEGLNQSAKTEELKKIIGEVPYLNGGLFEKDKDEKDSKIVVPNDCISKILHELFNRFNFTVTESTPLDEDVAVDPEMLGEVFEELVTGRHESGSYYTPKPVVSFMCREALKSYLGGYEELIDEQKADNINVNTARELLKKLEAVKVVDPACGSGAYLLGMLHELHALTRLLDTRAEQHTFRDDYRRKLSIIQKNLYGIDKDDFAVNIARLRLWLSLAVEFQGYPPEPLPNLDFKIEGGDSLIATIPKNIGEQEIKCQLIREYQEAKANYMRVGEGGDKETLKNEINNLEAQIATWTHGKNIGTGFDWVVKFAEVFAEDGFDIAVANPPYGASVDDNQRNLYFDKRTEGSQSKDTYGLFIARGLELLRPGGHLCYIVSDTWRTIKSHKPLRKRLLENTTISHIIDLPSWIFNATVNTCILTVTKNKAPEKHELITADLRNLKPGEWKILADNLTAIAAHSVDLQTINFARYTYKQSLISSYDNLPFFIGSPKLYCLMSDNRFTRLGSIADVKVGLQTGDNPYYLRKQVGTRGGYKILDESKLLKEEEIAQLTENEKLNGVDPEKYNGRCFLPYDKGGESDTDEGWLPNYNVPTQYFINWSQNAVKRLRTATIADVKQRKGEINKIKPGDNTKRAAVIRNPQYYFREGITFSPTGIYSPTFRLGCTAIFGNKGSTIFFNGAEAKVILGILTSTLARYLLKSYVSHTVETGEEVLKRFILPLLDAEFVDKLQNLVEQIIEKQKDNLYYPYHLHEQKEIDALVYQLYGVSEEDIREIELWYCRRYPKLAEAQGVIEEVNIKYKDYLAHCKLILQKPASYWKSHPILTLIAKSEGSKLELKEALFVDTKTGQKQGDECNNVLKTIVAFLNTDGGTVLIGVSNSCEIKGIQRDLKHCNRNDTDGFEKKLRESLSSRCKHQPLNEVAFTFVSLPEGIVARVDVQPISKEIIVYLDDEVYVRNGNHTVKLTGRMLLDWVENRKRI
jgi:type I restriction-modification system DNA methylase subunit